MCSIVAGFNKKQILELCRQNASRGQVAGSVTIFKDGILKSGPVRFLGAVEDKDIKFSKGEYCVVHQQAPTSEDQGVFNSNLIHPAQYNNNMFEVELFEYDLLWHNGMILRPDLEALIKQVGPSLVMSEVWDTDVLLRYLCAVGRPPSVNGSFACVHYSPSDGIRIFRNKRAPLYIDDELTISSTPFGSAKEIEPGIIYQLNFNNKTILNVGIGFDGGKAHFVDLTEEFKSVDVNPELADLLGMSERQPDPSVEFLVELANEKAMPADAGIVEVVPPLQNDQYKYQEDKHLAILKQYIDATYQNHYGKHGVQAIELILASGLGKGFFLGNVMKYAQRYGSKNGENKDDLLKILHYALLMLEDHEIRNGK